MLKAFFIQLVLLHSLATVVLSENSLTFDGEKKFSQIEVLAQQKDFGQVLDGTILSAEFSLKNVGTSPLNIIDIITDCACSVVEPMPRKIAVGIASDFTIKFNTAGFIGNQKKQIVLVTDSLKNSRTTFTLVAEVIPELDIQPSSLILPEATLIDLKKSYSFNLKVASQSAGKIKSVFAANESIKLNNLKLTEKSASFDLTSQEDISKEFKSRVIVELVDANRSSYNIPVRVRKKSLVKVTPPVVSFGVIDGDKSITRDFKVENSSQQELEILSLESSHPAIKVKRQPKAKYLFTVSVDPQLINKSLNSSITLKTNNIDYPELIISVIAILPPELQ